jgi:hypothetical protein
VKNLWIFLVVAVSFVLVHFIKSAGPEFKGVFDITDSSKALRLTTVTSEMVEQDAINFQVSNRSNFKYSDLLLNCEYMGSSGSTIKAIEVTLYEEFNYSSTSDLVLRELEIPEQTVRISCRSIDLKVISELTCYVSPKADSANKIKCLESEI